MFIYTYRYNTIQQHLTKNEASQRQLARGHPINHWLLRSRELASQRKKDDIDNNHQFFYHNSAYRDLLKTRILEKISGPSILFLPSCLLVSSYRTSVQKMVCSGCWSSMGIQVFPHCITITSFWYEYCFVLKNGFYHTQNFVKT